MFSGGPYSFLVGLFVSVPSLVGLLFFPVGLFVSVPSPIGLLFFPVGLFVFIPSPVGLLFFPVGLFMPLPSPVALLFFPLGLFMPADGSVPSTASPLFFPMGLFVLCAFSGWPVVLSGGSIYAFALSGCFIVLSDRFICACQWVCAFYGWFIVLFDGTVCVVCLLRWVCVSVSSPVALLFFPLGLCLLWLVRCSFLWVCLCYVPSLIGLYSFYCDCLCLLSPL